MLRTVHTTEAALARALARELEQRGVRFPAVFPYNRFEHERSAWWFSMKGSPAFSHAKVSIGRGPDGALEVGFVVEKGFELNDTRLVPAPQRLSGTWDWHALTPKMRERAFAGLLERLSPIGLRVRVHASPMSARGGASETLVFAGHPWTRVCHVVQNPAFRPLESVGNAPGMTQLVDALSNNPQRAFCWYDLYVAAPLAPALSDDDPTVLDEEVVDRLLLPLIGWFLPGLVPAEP